jgi:Uma2 family endonuclease
MYYVREEKSNQDGAYSLPEPDVAIARGRLEEARPGPPPLEQVALVVEVDHHTARADRVEKFSRYAARGVPVYWLIKAKRREVLVHDTPQGTGDSACYANTRAFTGVEEVPIVIDGKEVGRVAVPDLFPVEKAP